ncbi:hypothetical protein ONZ45_g1665 [Pleurotus djamor]|nr:hypothetical protein ONZ45_g1665 [Pleurotus djamor]
MSTEHAMSGELQTLAINGLASTSTNVSLEISERSNKLKRKASSQDENLDVDDGTPLAPFFTKDGVAVTISLLPDGTFRCERCQWTCSTSGAMSQHVNLRYSRNSVQCPNRNCLKWLKPGSDLNEHTKNYHPWPLGSGSNTTSPPSLSPPLDESATVSLSTPRKRPRKQSTPRCPRGYNGKSHYRQHTYYSSPSKPVGVAEASGSHSPPSSAVAVPAQPPNQVEPSGFTEDFVAPVARSLARLLNPQSDTPDQDLAEYRRCYYLMALRLALPSLPLEEAILMYANSMCPYEEDIQGNGQKSWGADSLKAFNAAKLLGNSLLAGISVERPS